MPSFAHVDMFAEAAALVTLVLLVWAIVRVRWFLHDADRADESRLSAVMIAVSAAVVAIVIAVAILGPHPS